MAAIKAKYRPGKNPEEEGRIIYELIHERKKRLIPSAYKIFAFEWNSHRGSVISKQEGERKSYLFSVSRGIKMDMERIRRVVRSLEDERMEFSAGEIAEKYLALTENNRLFLFMSKLIEKLKSNGRIRTSETYRATLNSFRNFREGKDILIECINKEIMESYEAWLRLRGLSSNTISFYMRVLRAVYNRAVDEELTENRHPFKRVYTGIDKTEKRALPIKIIKKIRGLDLSVDPQKDYARDMFILSFMLRGMSFVDMAFLKKSDLKNGHVSYRRRKTGQMLSIKWTSEMQEILNKYEENDSIYLLPIIRNPGCIPLYAYRNMSYSINRQLRKIATRLELPITLTMYVARHSWASAAKARGIPVSVISEGMGHDSEQTTQIYLSSLDTSIVDRANSLLLKDLSN